MNINDLVSRAAKYDEGLARDIQKFVESRQFGLVYEESKPEFVRLYKKPVVVGDTVNILPPRGVMENMSSDTDEHESKWRVVSITGKTAHLESLDSGTETDAALDDLVPFVRFDQPIYAGLKEVDRIERGGDKPYHVIVNGENFHALEALMFAYQGKVDCIYIDPPYNSGAKDWKYNNNYVGNEDIYRHSKWLTFMEDRLRLAKKLLNPQDSVLICTIDEKEYLHLGCLLENMFPEAHIQMVSSVINPKGSARDGFSRSDEYIFFIMFGECVPARLMLSNEWSSSAIVSAIENSDDDVARKNIEPGWTSMMRRGTDSLRTDSPNLYYPIYVDPVSKTIKKIGASIQHGQDRAKEIPGLIQVLPLRRNGSQGRWQVGSIELKNRIQQGRVRLGRPTAYGFVVNYLPDGEYAKVVNGEYEVQGYADDGSMIAYKKEAGTDELRMPSTQWKIASHNASENGTTLLTSVIGEKRFPFPKSVYAVRDCLRFFTVNKTDSLIVDFFAGSGTTLHAVNLLNVEDGGNRRCVLVTNNEVSADEAKQFIKRQLRQGDPDWEARGIAHYVTWPRTTCCINGVDVNGSHLAGIYIGTDRALSDGFEENAVFYDLEYLEPSVVQADMAFNEIAPLLWLKAGSSGRVIQHSEKYDITENYAVLFDYRYIGHFTRAVQKKPDVKTIFIVTDHDSRYRDMCAAFPDRNVTQLYEAYLRSFEISSEV